jgi:DNA-binding LytR/AlgR family response regulator
MKIAICDDELNMCERICVLIKEQNVNCDIDIYYSGEALLAAGNKYDIYFLDVKMQGISGMQAAKHLRENVSEGSVIIFITAFKDYMSEAFDVKAFHFLLKPVTADKFATVFARAMDEYHRITRYADKHIIIKIDNSHHKLRIRDIHYIESRDKKAVFYTKQGMIEAKIKIKELEKMLEREFFRCHRCYLVNLMYVTRYSTSVIWLTNGEEVLLAEKNFNDFVKAFMRFGRDDKIVRVIKGE